MVHVYGKRKKEMNACVILSMAKSNVMNYWVIVVEYTYVCMVGLVAC